VDQRPPVLLDYQQPPKEKPVTLRVVLMVIAFYLSVIVCIALLCWILVFRRIGS